jgi:hypothetical protein
VIFNKVCKILVSTFYDQFHKLPVDSSEWKQELKNFLENLEFPCVGASDGFHVYVSTKLKNYFSFKKGTRSPVWDFLPAVGAPG